MKKPLALLLSFISIFLFSTIAKAQSFGTFASAVWITDCNQSNFLNTSGTAANQFGPSAFDNANLGVYTQNSNNLILRGAGVKTSKTPGTANICRAAHLALLMLLIFLSIVIVIYQAASLQ